MTQDWNFFTKQNILNSVNQPQGNISNYQRMLAETDPRVLKQEPYFEKMARGIQQNIAKPQIIKNANPSLSTQLTRNIGATGKSIAKGGKVAGKAIGKASPFVGAGITGYDAFRSFQIADDMAKINTVQPGTFTPEEINFYRNKGKAIAAGMTTGGIGGGVLGAGAFSAPGAVLGAGIGGTIGDLGYAFAQRNNPYANAWDNASPEIKALLQQYYKDNKTGSGNNNNNGNNKSTTTKGGNGVSVRPLQPSQQVVAANIANELANKENTQSNMDAVNKYIEQLQAINQPYIQGLTDYYNNYNKLLDQAQRGAGYWQGIAALTGDRNWANMANYYNNLTNEANRLSALKQIQDAKAADINAITEALGNMEIARQLDISPEAAFANKNLLTALTANRRNLTDWEKAQLAAEMKRYGIDVGYNRAIDVQKLRNQGGLQNALIYAGMLGGGVAPGLNAQGSIPMMYNNTQIPVQQPQSLEASVYSQIKR